MLHTNVMTAMLVPMIRATLFSAVNTRLTTVMMLMHALMIRATP